MTMKEALSLVINETPLSIPDKEALLCYGMCKMTCNNDILEREKYDKLLFVEFLEFLGRIAEGKYNEEGLELVDKYEKLLEVIFTAFGMKLKSRFVEVEFVSCSEEDFDER